MADKIDLIVTSDALSGLDSLIKKLSDADKALNSLATDALNAGKQVGKINTPSDFNKFIKGQQDVNKGIKDQAAEIAKLEAAQKRLTFARSAEGQQLDSTAKPIK